MNTGDVVKYVKLFDRLERDCVVGNLTYLTTSLRALPQGSHGLRAPSGLQLVVVDGLLMKVS